MNKSLANHEEIVTKPMIGVHRYGSWASFRQSSRSDSMQPSFLWMYLPSSHAQGGREDHHPEAAECIRHQRLERRPDHLADVFCWRQPRRCSLDHSSFPFRLSRREDAVRCAALCRSLSDNFLYPLLAQIDDPRRTRSSMSDPSMSWPLPSCEMV